MSIGSNGSGNGNGDGGARFGRGRANVDASIGRLGDLVPELAPAKPKGLPGPLAGSWSIEDDPSTGGDWARLILKYAGAGVGRASACREVGVTLGQLEARLDSDPAFRAELLTLEESRTDDCLSVIYDDALTGRSVPSAAAYVKLTNDRKVTEEAVKRLDQSSSHQGQTNNLFRFNCENLADDEMHEFGDLLDAIWAKANLSPEEASSFAHLFGKAVRPVQPAPQAPELEP